MPPPTLWGVTEKKVTLKKRAIIPQHLQFLLVISTLENAEDMLIYINRIDNFLSTHATKNLKVPLTGFSLVISCTLTGYFATYTPIRFFFCTPLTQIERYNSKGRCSTQSAPYNRFILITAVTLTKIRYDSDDGDETL
ncbi:hypothetical protein NQ318_013827 [Aromia moschata]|uniref:Uncharacterized protein n=1 Tax=Aromia moschata TaxID=1265417 RepID=A0AAV8Z8H5_9CUCU|nr:hypothetical protein NQ318_013827 [Aromia moschata]